MARSSRFVFVRLESASARWLVLAVVLVAAGTAAWSVIKPGIADWVGRGALDIAGIEWVAAWDPGNPSAHSRAAMALAESTRPEDLARARAHAEAALRLNPADGFTWFRMAEVMDRLGDRVRSGRALATALRHDPHNVALRWEAATLLMKWGEERQAVEHLRYVLAVDPAQRHVAFQILRQLSPRGEPVEKSLPDEPEALTNLLSAGIREGDVPLARAAWERRVRLAPPLPEPLNRGYLNLLLDQRDGEAAARAWAVVAPAAGTQSQGNLIWNGNFEGDPLVGWGLGWRNARTWGVQVQIDRTVAARGGQSLRLSFNSFPNLEFRNVYQPVAVRPGQSYRLEALAKASDFVTRSGLKLQVLIPGDEPMQVIAETGTVSGTTPDWVHLSARVDVPAGISLIVVALRREKATQPEGNLGGKVWVDGVSLLPLKGGPA